MIEYYITSISNLSCEMTEEIISNSSKFRIDKYNAINSKEVKNIDSNIFDKVLSGDEKNNVCTTINDGLADNNNELQLEKFFYYWVQKETILKRDGSGLKDDISKIYDTYGVVKKLMYNKQKNSIDKMLDVHNIEDLSKIKLQDFEKYDIYLMCINNGKSDEFIELHEGY